MSDKLKKWAEANKILEIKSGSHLYGLTTEDSDLDLLGIFMPPEEYVLGLKNVNEVDLGIKSKDESGKNTKDALDKKFYEFRKFITLALDNNPNILEVLYANEYSITHMNSIGQDLLNINHLFPCKRGVYKLQAYANAQKHKMIIKRDNFNKLLKAREELEEFMNTKGPKTTMSEVQLFSESATFEKKNSGSHIKCGDLSFEPGVYVKKALKKVKERLDKATNRTELILKYGYDQKFGSHLVRLLSEGVFLLDNGYLEFPLPNRAEILNIKLGNWKLEEVLERAEDLEKELEDKLNLTKLPEKPYIKEVESFTIKTMREFLFGRS